VAEGVEIGIFQESFLLLLLLPKGTLKSINFLEKRLLRRFSFLSDPISAIF